MGSSDSWVYNSQLDSFTLYHIVNESNSQSSIAGGPILPALGHALAGSVGSAAGRILTYPIDLVVTRLQVQKQLREKGETESAAKDADAEYNGLMDAARKIYKNEGGLPAFFTGLGPDVAKGIIDSFLFFLAYNFLRTRELRKRNAKELSVGRDLFVGVAAGSFSKLITTPIQSIVTRQQTAALVAARDPEAASMGDGNKMSVKNIALQIHREKGITGFWAGYSASVILTINPAITFAADNLLKSLLPQSRRENPGQHFTFLIAALSKAIATSITYPVQLAKSRAQAASAQSSDNNDQSGDKDAEETFTESPEKSESVLANQPARRQATKRQLSGLLRLFSGQYAIMLSLRRIYQREGLGGLYSGLEGEVLKGFLSHGLTMMMKENVHVGVIQLYYLLLRLTKRWPDELRKAQDSVAAAGQAVSNGTSKLVDETKKAAGMGK